MDSNHFLLAFEEELLEDGTKAVCSCGWRSSLQIDINKAMEHLMARRSWEQHRERQDDDRLPAEV